MPCDSVRTMQVKIEAADRRLLKKALEKLGYAVQGEGERMYAYDRGRSITITKDSATVRQGEEYLIEEINRAYSAVVIEETAEMFGMQIEPESELEGQLVMVEYE